MGKWEKQLEVNKERKDKDKVRREKLAGYFFDVSKLSFAGLVIGIGLPLFANVGDVKIWCASYIRISFNDIVGIIS